MSPSLSNKPGNPDANDARRAANAVEALSNIVYLIENSVDSPVRVRAYTELAHPALTVLIDYMQEQQ